MKKMIMTMALVFGAIGLFAQANNLSVTNSSGVAITVTCVAVNSSCGVIGQTVAQTIQPGQTATFTPINGAAGNDWWAARAFAPPANPPGFPLTATIYNKCLTNCSGTDFGSGLSGLWNSITCDAVTFF